MSIGYGTWIRIRSWHAVKTYTRAGSLLTLCGRTVTNGPTQDDLPAGKSCETCLRIFARANDKA